MSLIMAIWKRALTVSTARSDGGDAGPGEGALDEPALGLDDEYGVGPLEYLGGTLGGRGDARPW